MTDAPAVMETSGTSIRRVPTVERVADAAITVIAREGLDALSVRRVARAADVTGGAVQHHYATRAELTVAALDRTVQRQTARMRALERSASVVDGLVRSLCCLLPVDEASHDEAVVWIAMSAAVVGQPLIQARHREAVEGTRAWLASVVRKAQAAGEVPSSLDPVTTALMLEAALDGMLLQTILEPPADAGEPCRLLDTMVRRLLLCPPARPRPRTR